MAYGKRLFLWRGGIYVRDERGFLVCEHTVGLAMIYQYEIDNLPVQTGDIICTTDGINEGTDLKGQFWRLLGKLIPGDVDHTVIYIGPKGRCVEAGARGKVITFEVREHSWDSKKRSCLLSVKR